MTDRPERGVSVAKPCRESHASAPVRAYVGLGANLGDRHETIRRALDAIGSLDGVRLLCVSKLRETDPVGVIDQPRFVNGACALETTLSARALLKELLAIELRLGRARDGRRWGPRSIDLDLLLYADCAVDTPGLTVPHPRLHERGFVLEPLLDLEPDLRLPDTRSVKDLLSEIK